MRVWRVLEAVKPPKTYVGVWPESLRKVRPLARKCKPRYEIQLAVSKRLSAKELEHQKLHWESDFLQALSPEVEAHAVSMAEHHAARPQRVCTVVQTIS